MAGGAVLTVACVLRWGGCYTTDYVERLRDGVSKHLQEKHNFICLSDVAVSCGRIPLVHNWPGWWSKMELFKLLPPVLYFDLDTVITGDLSDIAAAAHEHPLILLRDFYREKGFGSGMMAWATDQSAIYDKFAADSQGIMGRLGGRGDQGFIEETVARSAVSLWHDLLPGQVVSYKAHVRNKQFPADARVVCFHGKPRPHEVEGLW